MEQKKLYIIGYAVSTLIFLIAAITILKTYNRVNEDHFDRYVKGIEVRDAEFYVSKEETNVKKSDETIKKEEAPVIEEEKLSPTREDTQENILEEKSVEENNNKKEDTKDTKLSKPSSYQILVGDDLKKVEYEKNRFPKGMVVIEEVKRKDGSKRYILKTASTESAEELKKFESEIKKIYGNNYQILLRSK